jgi:hypothetical protein
MAESVAITSCWIVSGDQLKNYSSISRVMLILAAPRVVPQLRQGDALMRLWLAPELL